MIRLLAVLLLLCPSVCLALPLEFYGPDPGEMVPAGDWGTGYDGANTGDSERCSYPVYSGTPSAPEFFKVELFSPFCCGGVGYDFYEREVSPTEVTYVRVRNMSADGGCESTAGNLPDCDCEEPGPSCGTLVTSDSTIEDPDAIDGGTTTEVNTYDTDDDGIADCKKRTGGCASGDQICECLEGVRAEIAEVKTLLSAAELPALKALLSEIAHPEGTLTLSAYEPVPNIPGFEGNLNLPFNGMPGHSVLTTLSSQTGGLPTTIQQSPLSVNVKLEQEGMVEIDEDITTHASGLVGGFGGKLEQARVLIRGFLLVVVIWNALSHVWDVLLKL